MWTGIFAPSAGNAYARINKIRWIALGYNYPCRLARCETHRRRATACRTCSSGCIVTGLSAYSANFLEIAVAAKAVLEARGARNPVGNQCLAPVIPFLN